MQASTWIQLLQFHRYQYHRSTGQKRKQTEIFELLYAGPWLRSQNGALCNWSGGLRFAASETELPFNHSTSENPNLSSGCISLQK